MSKKISKSVLVALMVFGCLNLCMLTSCNDEKAETTAPVEAAVAPVESAVATPAAAPTTGGKDSVQMGSAETRPVSPAVKK